MLEIQQLSDRIHFKSPLETPRIIDEYGILACQRYKSKSAHTLSLIEKRFVRIQDIFSHNVSHTIFSLLLLKNPLNFGIFP